MEIGTWLNLELTDEDQQLKRYRCKVIEKNNHFLFIDYPVNEETKRTALFPNDTYFTVTYIGKDRVAYQFSSKIVTKVNLQIPALAIELPDQNKIKRIQRRNYVRVKTALDIAIHSVDQSFSPFVTVTDDISGGGVSILLPKKSEVAVGERVDVWLTLPMKSGENKYMNSTADIVYMNVKNQLHLASLKFISIDKQDQQMIIQYCFGKQRENRRKELE